MKNAKDIVNLVSGDISPEEKKKVLSEVKTNEEGKELFFKMKAAWAVLSSTKTLPDYDIEKSYMDLKKQLEGKKISFYSRIKPVLKYAAIFIILTGFAIFWYLNKHQQYGLSEEFKYTSVVAEKGQISKIILPDSSIVWLNSGTTLSYNNGYSVNNRDLFLNGQAYLSVKKDRNNPLIVACNDLRVKVLGTKFDVSAYPGDDKINVVLESGSIELLQAGNDEFKYLLKPGEMAQYNARLKKIIIKNVETIDFTNWKEGYLIFKDTPMADVIERLERKFNIEVTVKNKEVYKSIFNASFKDEKLKEILDYIEYSCPIKYKLRKGDNVNKPIVELYTQTN
ncbi:FecR family protein [Maribellus maritimus]|uniref:FecR family protein n=1 Tax=Maribellus maritimus TaxID=2870838 RepID=UPI001EEACE09|nr:FecR family protein [Maribellus maritimus]MCG6190908.1 DUF4974 domain-containing protein [Maribellus maritimus]